QRKSSDESSRGKMLEARTPKLKSSKQRLLRNEDEEDTQAEFSLTADIDNESIRRASEFAGTVTGVKRKHSSTFEDLTVSSFPGHEHLQLTELETYVD